MNNFSLGISGSWFLLIFIIIISIGIAYWSYRITIPPITSRLKLILISLRSIGLALLVFILFEPIISIIGGKEIPSKILLILDNTVSTVVNDAGGARKAQYDKVLSHLANHDKELFKTVLFDANTKELEFFSSDLLKRNGQQSDIARAISYSKRLIEKDNIKAAILITDGEFNTGNNPIYPAQRLGVPIYTVGIGDSTKPKDVSIYSIITNDVAYVNSSLPVNINVSVVGFANDSIKIELFENEAYLGSQEFLVSNSNQMINAVFEYNPKSSGDKKIIAKINHLKGEITYKNNTSGEFVKVLDKRKRLAIFSGSPSSDLSFFKNAVREYDGLDIVEFIQKQGGDFYSNAPTASALKDAEIIVMIGFPIYSTKESAINLIKNELKGGKKSLFFMPSKDLDYSKLKQIQEFLPFTTISTRPIEFQIFAEFRNNALSSPICKLESGENSLAKWNELPPIFKTETFVEAKPESELLATMKINNNSIFEPVIMSRNINNQRAIATTAYGLYRWKLIGFGAERAKGNTSSLDLFSIFIKNSLKWLSVDLQKEQLVIKPTKANYSNGENVELIAQVYDASFNPFDNAIVKAELSENNEIREIGFNNIGNGRYIGRIEGLSNGDFKFSGVASYNSNLIGKSEGRFTIGEVDLEFRNLSMNAQLLRSIANNTGGVFLTANRSDRLIDIIRNNINLKPDIKEIKNEIALWNYIWLLTIAILSFIIEWVLRKRAGMI